MRINLHNHTTFSDGRLAPERLIGAARRFGLSHVGVSDHFSTSKLPADLCVQPETLGEYVARISRLADACRGSIRVLVGLEVDFSARRTDLEFLRVAAQRDALFADVDYVLFEYVGETGEGTLDEFLQMRPFLPCPVGLAHASLAETFRRVRPETLVRRLAAADVFVELCTSRALRRFRPRRPRVPLSPLVHDLEGLEHDLALVEQQAEAGAGAADLQQRLAELREAVRRIEANLLIDWPFDNGSIFCDLFWRAALEEGLLLSVGSDSHALESEVGDIEPALEFLRARGLEAQLITRHRWLDAKASPSLKET